MNYSDFINAVPIIKNLDLGGLDAQFKLAPSSRKPYSEELINAKLPKKSAVLALFYPNENRETEFLLTLRANYKGVHASQISFPGGKFEKSDDNLTYTALRETNEEIGIATEKITIFKQLTNVYIPPSNFLVTPIMGFITAPPKLILNNEVEKVIPVAIKELLTNQAVSTTIVTTSYAKKMEVPCFILNKTVVWGATAMMLSEIRELLKKV
jgi:8-oxo-dGTP pyrophosphatase MutT (NUDIX family)